MKCDLLRSLEEDHLLHGFQRPHDERAIQATAGEMAASHTEGHTGHLQRFKQQRGVYITSGRIQEGKEQVKSTTESARSYASNVYFIWLRT